MKKVLALTFITFAIAALVTGMTVITTQIVNAENDFGKAVSGIARDTDGDGPDVGQSECNSGGTCLGLGDGKTEECGGDGCDSDGTGNSGKQFGKDVSGAASKNK
jgi:hypothetical protein